MILLKAKKYGQNNYLGLYEAILHFSDVDAVKIWLNLICISHGLHIIAGNKVENYKVTIKHWPGRESSEKNLCPHRKMSITTSFDRKFSKKFETALMV